MLLDFGVTPYLVFDGASLPSKAETNASRKIIREKSKVSGHALYAAGNTSAAYNEFQKGVEITTTMVACVVRGLRRANVQYIIAPYEADAQLVYLERQGIIDAILSEDSDLLVFGAKHLITKLDQYGGCTEIDRDDFASCRDISLVGWTDAMFRRMAILSGCDYLRNIPKLGLQNAYRYVRTYKDLDKMFQMIQLGGKFVVPIDYPQQFRNAELTFLHQRVFCPIKQMLVFLDDLPPGLKAENLPFLGEDMDPQIAIGVACGQLDSKSKLPSKSLAAPPMKRTTMSQAQRSSSTSMLKPSKSIESFFKPNREPLQELDPNSLTPSPSQRRLLTTYANASWDMRTVSSAPQLRRAMTSLSSPASPLATDNLNASAFLAKAAMKSTYKPPKRQRLCSELDEVSPSKEVKQSPYFTTPTSVGQRTGKAKKARKSDFEVWSDDSLCEESLLALPDVHQKASPPKSSVLYPELPPEINDGVDVIPQSSPAKQEVEDGDASDGQGATEVSQPHVSQLNLTSDGARAPENESFEDLLEVHSQSRSKSMLKTFVYQSSTARTTALAKLSPKANQPLLVPDAPPTPSSHRPDSESSTRRQSPDMSRTFVSQSANLRVTALQSLSPRTQVERKIELVQETTIWDAGTDTIAQDVETLVKIGQQALETPTRDEAVPLRGSEDDPIPDTEDEESIVGGSPPRTRLNLQAYVYTN